MACTIMVMLLCTYVCMCIIIRSMLISIMFTYSTVNDAPANFHLSQKSYERTVYVGDAKVGMELVTVKLNITNNDSLRSHSAHYGIHGYGSRLFQIGHSSGIITLKKKFEGTTHRYSFEATCYFIATFKNGSVLYSSLETTVLINFDSECYY